jgi:hypothetical protein
MFTSWKVRGNALREELKDELLAGLIHGRHWNAAKAMDRHGNKLLVVVRLKETRA